MRIFFNEQQLETNATSLLGVMEEQQLAEKKGIAVAVNEEVIARAQWEELPVAEDDTILVITAAAGG
jgi:sulfur carrier protein